MIPLLLALAQIDDLVSEKWGVASRAKIEFESKQAAAIPDLLKLMDRDEKVKLRDTADLIYPGAEKFYGHGWIVDYDLDWLPVRAGWVLEDLTFQRFGFKEGAIKEDELLRAAALGNKDVPLEDVVKLQKDPEVRKKIRTEAVARAKLWWEKSSKTWTRYAGLLEALDSDDADRLVWTINWIRYGRTPCDGLDMKSYEKDVLPRIRKLAEHKEKGPRDQARLLLDDEEGYWLKIKKP